MHSNSAVQCKHAEMHTYFHKTHKRWLIAVLLIIAPNLEIIQMPNNRTMNKEMNDPKLHTATWIHILAQLRTKESTPCESIHLELKTGKAGRLCVCMRWRAGHVLCLGLDTGMLCLAIHHTAFRKCALACIKFYFDTVRTNNEADFRGMNMLISE